MGKTIAPWREGMVLHILLGPHTGFIGTVVKIDEEDDNVLLVNKQTQETHCFNVHRLDTVFGRGDWFEWVETAKTPVEVIDDLILDWNRDYMDFKWRYEDVVIYLKEAKERIEALSKVG